MPKNQMHNDVFTKLTSQLDLSDIHPEHTLMSIADAVVKALEVEQVSIWQFMPFSMRARCVAVSAKGAPQKPKEMVDLTPITALVPALQTEFSIAILNIAKDVRTSALPKEYWMSASVKSSLHVPIRVVRKIQGILRVDSKSERNWTPEETQFCERIANLASQIMLTVEVDSAAQRARLLGDVSSEITYRYNVPTLLNDLVRRCVETLNATEGALYLADPEQKTLIGKAGYNVPSKFIGAHLAYGEDVPGKVAETGMDMLIKDYRTWAGRTQTIGKKEIASSIISVPIHHHGDVTGVLQVARRDGGRSFQNIDREVVHQFGSLASLAIEKHRLAERSEHLKKFQETLAHLIQAGNMSNNVMDCMEISSDFLAHTLDVPSIIVRFENEISLRGMSAEADTLIEAELQKQSRQFDVTIVAPDLESLKTRFPALAGFMNRMRLKACILKPIRINHERNGFVFVATNVPRAWTSEEIGLVEVASQQIGLSIESIHYHQETQSYADLIRQLTGATSIINRLVPLEELISMIGQRALQLSNTNKLALLLREQDGVVRASWVFGVTKPEFDKVAEKEGAQILDAFARETAPISLMTVSESSLPQMLKKQLVADKVKSARLTPIVHSGNVIGMIAAFDETPTAWPSQEREMMMIFANAASLALQSAWYYEQLEKGYLDLALTLVNTIDSRESDVKASSMRIAEWSNQTAKLLGLSTEEQELIQWAAMLHNIGKVEVPEHVLLKPGPLSAEERKVVEQYPIRSENLLRPLTRFKEVGKVLRNVRERFDGKGYPDRKKGEDIPLSARILAVADTYGSMIENRPYRQAHSHESAVRELTKNKGTQFDPIVVDAFLQAVSVQGTVQ